MDTKTIIVTFFAFLTSFAITLVDTNKINNNNNLLALDTIKRNQAELVYRVYLGGKSLGIISSGEELENYIDKEQAAIKSKYNVDKVYAPNDLDIVKEYTYDEKMSTAKDIYNHIKEVKGVEAFTINGYKIIIEGTEEETEEGIVQFEDVNIYVLDRMVFESALESAIKAFVDPDDYEDYQNSITNEIKETGKIVEKLYLKNNIKIIEERIPTGEKIYTDESSLSKFLIFGDNTNMTSYTVQEGDNIEDVSFANKISTEEFLIANTNFTSKDDLLYPGQVVSLGELDPKFRVVEQDYVVSKKVINYETKYINDDSQYVGYEKVTQNGEDGLSLVTERQIVVNGELTNTTTIGEAIELKPSVEKIVVRGTKQKPIVSVYNGEVPVEIGSWVWPTVSGYTISSNYGWRWGKFHEGLDIASTGYGSPIKAANNGLVVQSGYTSTNGNYIVIAHSNGYYTMYAHMSGRTKSAGAVVMAGDVIGYMGKSGFATGVHLHFAIYNGYPYRGGKPMNPFKSVY